MVQTALIHTSNEQARDLPVPARIEQDTLAAVSDVVVEAAVTVFMHC